MIHVDLNEATGVIVVRPERMHGLSDDDFADLRATVDGYVAAHGALNALVIVADRFPGWEDFTAFVSHVRFVRDHHRKIGKVAIVSDDRVLSAAPHLVGHFVQARVRHFARDEVAAALAWSAKVEPRGGMALLDGYPDDVVAVRATGTITSEDYETMLIPAVEEKLRAGGRVKLLLWCGPEFDGMSAGALWDDARFGVTHIGDFVRIAVVSDIGWIRQSAKLFAPLVGAPVRVFGDAEIGAASRWIGEDDAAAAE